MKANTAKPPMPADMQRIVVFRSWVELAYNALDVPIEEFKRRYGEGQPYNPHEDPVGDYEL
jgi:hypothetical protein